MAKGGWALSAVLALLLLLSYAGIEAAGAVAGSSDRAGLGARLFGHGARAMGSSARLTRADGSGTLAPSFFGMNMYLTNPARSDGEVALLSPMAQAIHIGLSREQISWATYDTPWGPAFFDARIGLLAEAGFGIIGILVTTPERYTSPQCRACADQQGLPRYFCPPRNPNDFAAFAATVVERYDGDGYQDAPGSPRIDYWEVWNEPDQPATWVTCTGHNDPVAYEALLEVTYQAIKQADPSAQVLVGGMTDGDTVGLDGFMDRVVAAGGWPYFDILSYHPFFLGHPPEAPGLAWNMPHRLQMVQDWIAAHGGGKEAWATEFGWSTCTIPGDPRCRTEEQQANYLVRAYGLLLLHRFEHGTYFHLKDLAGGAPTPYQECAVIRPDYSTKPSYTAYGVMVSLLGDMRYVGVGPLHRVQDTWNDRYDLRFRRSDGARVDLLWQLQGQNTYAFLVEPGVEQVYLYDRDGSVQLLTPQDGTVPVTLSERPCYLWRLPTGPAQQFFFPLIPR